MLFNRVGGSSYVFLDMFSFTAGEFIQLKSDWFSRNGMWFLPVLVS